MAARLRDVGHDDVTFVGTPDGLEARLVPEVGIGFVGLPARGFDRSRPWLLTIALAVLAISTVRMTVRLLRARPDVVAGFGGYVSLPVGLAAVLARIPLVLHEQNSVPGMANRVLSRFAVRVAITYPGSASRLARPERAVVTGNPVREPVLAATRREGRTRFGIADEERLLLVFGGSRGARHLNTAMAGIASRVLAHRSVRVLHIAGRDECDSVKAALGEVAEEGRYRVVDYIDGMGEALAAADLVIARAGATSIAEITALGVPSILVPYPFATDDHQTSNAQTLVAAGGARVVPDAELDSEMFAELVTQLLADDAARATMSAASRALGVPDAAKRVADVVLSAARKSTGAKGETA